MKKFLSLCYALTLFVSHSWVNLAAAEVLIAPVLVSPTIQGGSISTNSLALGGESVLSGAAVKQQIDITANPKAMAQGVALNTSSLTVADSVHTSFASDFTLHTHRTLPSSGAGTFRYLHRKLTAVAGYVFGVNTANLFVFQLNSGSTASVYITAISATPYYDTPHKYSLSVSQSTATAYLCIDGVLVATIPLTGGIRDVSVSTPFYPAYQSSGGVYSTFLYNRALSVAEIASLCSNGVAESDRGGSQTAQTSGTLAVGKRYIIDTFVAGDSFANVGAASNASGVSFVATGATPTTWTNASSLRRLGATLRQESEGIQLGAWFDSGANSLHASYPTSGWSPLRQVIDNGMSLPSTVLTGSATLTIAQLLTRELQDTHATGATATYTLPTAALMDAALPGMPIGYSFDWTLINASAAALDTVTIAPGTGHTVVGAMVVQSAHTTTGGLYGNAITVRTKKTGISTYVTSRR